MITPDDFKRLLKAGWLNDDTYRRISTALCPHPVSVEPSEQELRAQWLWGFGDRYGGFSRANDHADSPEYLNGWDACDRCLTQGYKEPAPDLSEAALWRAALVEHLTYVDGMTSSGIEIDLDNVPDMAAIHLMDEFASRWARDMQEDPIPNTPEWLLKDLDAAIALLQQWRGYAQGVLEEAHKEVMGDVD